MDKTSLPIYNINSYKNQDSFHKYFYIKSFQQHINDYDFISKPHKHDFFLLVYVNKGSGSHTIDFDTYSMLPGSFFFISPGQVHSWELSEDIDGYILFFSADYYMLYFSQKNLYNYPFFHTIHNKPYLYLENLAAKRIEKLFEDIHDEFTSENFGNDDIIRDFLDILLIQSARMYRIGQEDKESNSLQRRQLRLLETLVDKYYKEIKAVADYAEKMHITAKHLNVICKSSVDQTASELIQTRILLEARRMLIHSGMSVAQISEELGYTDHSYFNRFFKKHIKLTPEQFRQHSTLLSEANGKA